MYQIYSTYTGRVDTNYTQHTQGEYHINSIIYRQQPSLYVDTQPYLQVNHMRREIDVIQH